MVVRPRPLACELGVADNFRRISEEMALQHDDVRMYICFSGRNPIGGADWTIFNACMARNNANHSTYHAIHRLLTMFLFNNLKISPPPTSERLVSPSILRVACDVQSGMSSKVAITNWKRKHTFCFCFSACEKQYHYLHK